MSNCRVSVRSRLLASVMISCFPAAAIAADTTVGSGQTVGQVQFSGSDHVTVAAGGTIAATNQISVMLTGNSTGAVVDVAGTVAGSGPGPAIGVQPGIQPPSGPITITIADSGVIDAQSRNAPAIALGSVTGPVTINQSGDILGGLPPGAGQTVAIVTGSGDDTINLFTGSPGMRVFGSIVLGAGTDTINLNGLGTTRAPWNPADRFQSLGRVLGGEQLNVNSGYWKLVDEAQLSSIAIASGASFEVDDVDATNGAFITSPTGSLNIANSGALIVNTADTRLDLEADSLHISGAGTLELTGGGSIQLGQNFAQTGRTTITNGTIVVTGDNIAAPFTVAGAGILRIGAAFSQPDADGFVTIVNGGGATGSLSGNITNNNRVYFDRSGDLVYAGNITGGGLVHKLNGGVLTLSGQNAIGQLRIEQGGVLLTGSQTGATAVLAGASLEIAANGVSGRIAADGATVTNRGAIDTPIFAAGTAPSVGFGNSGSVLNNAGLIRSYNNHAVTFGSGADTLNLSTGSVIIGRVEMGGGTDTINLAGTSTVATNAQELGNIFGSEILNVNSGFWTMKGETFADQVNIAAGASLDLYSVGAAPGEGGYISSNGDTLTIANNGAVYVTTDDARLDIYADDLHLGGSGTLELRGGGSIQYGQNITLTGATTVTNGMLVVTGDNLVTPITVGAQGTLRVGAAYTAPDADGYVNIVAGGGTTGSLTGNVTNSGQVIFDRSNASTYSGVMSGTGALTKSGAGVLTLSGANTYTGATTVTGGGLVVSAPFASNVSLASGTDLTFTGPNTMTYAGVVSGAGALTKTGGGTLILTGQNTLTGGTTISGGTLQIGNGGATGALSGPIVNNGVLVYNKTSGSGGLSNISGSGSLRVDAGTLALGGVNTYTGGTTVAAGGTLGLSVPFNGDIVNNGVVDFGLPILSSRTYSGAISGTGYVNVVGIEDETLTLTGANTFTGGLTVYAQNNLRIGAGGTTGSIVSNVLNNGTVIFDRSDNVAYGGVITGTGRLYKSGAGVLTLSAGGSYAGATFVTAGGLVVAAPLASGSVNIASGANLTFTGPNALTYAGVVSGAGSLAKTGSGLLTLSGANTHTGGTNVQAGGLRVTGSVVGLTSLASGTTLEVAAGGSARFINGNGVSVVNAGTIETPLVTTGSAATIALGDAGASLTNLGVIRSYNGNAVRFGAGADVLNLATGSSITGRVDMGAGNDTINLAGTSAAKAGSQTLGFIFGSETLNVNSGYWTLNREVEADFVNVAGGATLELDSVGAAPGEGGFISGNAAVKTIVNSGAIVLNTDDARLDDGADSLRIGGSGTVELKGGGALQYGANTTLTGATTVTNGTLVVTGDNIASAINVGAQGTVRVGAAYSAPDADGFVTLVSGGGTTGSVAGNIANSGAVIFDRANASTYAGVMSGTGAVTKNGAGVLTLLGGNTYTGATTVNAGGLVVSAPFASSGVSLAGGTSLTFTGPNALTYAGVVSGQGGLSKTGTGVVTLSGANTYTGATTVSGGNLTVTGSIASQSVSVASGATFTFGSAANQTYGGVVSGAGSLAKSGAGALTLTGANTYTGATSVTGGSLILATTLSSNVTVAQGGTLQIGTGGTAGHLAGALRADGTVIFNRSDDYVYAGAFSGAGSLIKRGAGLLTLDGVYTFSGTTTIEAGTIKITQLDAGGSLVVGSGSTVDLSGGAQTVGGLAGGTGSTVNIQNATLTVNQAPSTTPTVFNGALTGAGSLVVTGGGILDLAGNNTYTGPTTVNGGTLKVNGSISSPVTVNNGGTLGGSGTINGAVTIGSGGSISPGNSPGVTNIAGSLTLASGASMIVEVDPTATIKNDRINVTAGSATITAGAKLDVRPLGAIANYDRVSDYTILTATGGVSGTFGNNVTSTMALLTPSVSYSANEVSLRLIRNDISFASLANTSNQAAVAGAAEATGPSGAAYGALIGQDAAGARAGYDALSGELYGATSSLMIDDGRHQRAILLGQAASRGAGAWARMHSGEATIDASAGTAEVSNRGFGVVGGGQVESSDWNLGFGLGYGSSEVEMPDRASMSDVTTLRAGVYAGTEFGAWRVRLGADAAKHDFESRRGIVFPTVNETVAARYDGSSRQIFGEVAYAMDIAGGRLEPFLEVAGVWAKTDGFAETGGTLGLDVAEQDRSVTFATVGARFTGAYDTGGAVIRPQLSLAWRRAGGDIEGASTGGFGASDFTVVGAGVAEDTVLIDAGAGFDITPSVTGSLSYSGALSSDAKDHAVRAGLFVRF